MSMFALGFLVGVGATCTTVAYALDRILRGWQP